MSDDSHPPAPSSVAAESLPMLGAIVGDIAGSVYERHNCKSTTKCKIFHKKARATDDSILTLATAQQFLTAPHFRTESEIGRASSDSSTRSFSYAHLYQQMGRAYPRAGYGGNFIGWIFMESPEPYNSWGNGSAMRASPIGWVADVDTTAANDGSSASRKNEFGLEWAMEEAKRSAEVSHNHPEGIKGAQAIVASIILARQGKDKEEIRSYISNKFGYNLNRTVDQIRPSYTFDVSCQGSVPEAIVAFLDSTDFESALRNAISLGGDSDTIACMAGAIAHAYYKFIPEWMVNHCRNLLDPFQLSILDNFWDHYEKGIFSRTPRTAGATKN